MFENHLTLSRGSRVALQQARDLIKQGICVREGIRLVVVPSRDLSLQGMLEKVGYLLPLRHLRRDAPVVRFLESVSRAYREPAAPFTPTGRRQKGSGFRWLAGQGYGALFDASRGLRYVFASALPGAPAKIYPNQDRSPDAGGVK